MPHVARLALLGLILTTAPAAADPAKDKAAPQDQTKYCIQVEASTGSRINRTECRTRAEWAELGVDVDQVLAK